MPQTKLNRYKRRQSEQKYSYFGTSGRSIRMEPENDHIVLFVCIENTFRSILSEAIFNAHAPKGWRAESAGARHASAINPVVVDLLAEIGMRTGPRKPRIVTGDIVERAERVITFGCLDECPVGAKEKSADWPLPGATGKTLQELRAIRDELSKRITTLIEDLQ